MTALKVRFGEFFFASRSIVENRNARDENLKCVEGPGLAWEEGEVEGKRGRDGETLWFGECSDVNPSMRQTRTRKTARERERERKSNRQGK